MASTTPANHSYADGPPRQVPGLDGLHRMTRLLLEERVPEHGQVLVLGAGGGMELTRFAEANSGWHFDGVDPSADMLEAARVATLPFESRVRLHQGTIVDAPLGPFDGATCLLTMHFIPREQRLATLRGVRERLRLSAPFVMAHMSFDEDANSREVWSRRHAAFAVSNGLDAVNMERGRQAILERLTILSPTTEESLLREAGFTDVALFYAGFDFRGWVAYAG